METYQDLEIMPNGKIRTYDMANGYRELTPYNYFFEALEQQFTYDLRDGTRRFEPEYERLRARYTRYQADIDSAYNAVLNAAAKLREEQAKAAEELRSQQLWAGSLKFEGAGSGIRLPMFDGYPADFPQMQLTEDQQLKFWNWPGWNENFLSFDNITWLPSKPKDLPAGYYFVPLYKMELGRFLSGYNGGKTYQDVYAARKKMFFSNEVVYIKDGICYDPNSASSWVLLSKPSQPNHNWYNGLAVTQVKAFADLASVTGGYWAWKYMDGWQLLWRGVQYYIDEFLKVPYNVYDLIAYGKSYPNVFKDALMKKTESDRRNAITGVLSVVNFLEQPVGKPGFWDKFVNFIPLIWATAASIVTAGLGSPVLIAAVGALGSKLVAQGKVVAAANAQKVFDQEMNNVDNIRQDEIDKYKGEIDAAQTPSWLWLLLGAGALFLFNKKNRK